jgi:hypothetical protein
MSTNYPLVRITNTGSGHVVYARTHDHSRMGVEPVGDPEIVSTNFDVPGNLELGASTLVVGAWTSTPGNSPGPPATLPSYMGVVVSSSVLQSGSAISGDVPKIVVIHTNPGYRPDPGSAGTGTVVATYCGH